jgi:hypothetical protein
LVGAVIGFLISILLLAAGDAFQGLASGLGSASALKDANSISFLAGMGALWSVIGVTGALLSLVAKRPVAIIAGIIMLISAFGGLLVDSIGIFFVLSFILLLIAGIMCFRKKHIQQKAVSPTVN